MLTKSIAFLIGLAAQTVQASFNGSTDKLLNYLTVQQNKRYDYLKWVNLKNA